MQKIIILGAVFLFYLAEPVYAAICSFEKGMIRTIKKNISDEKKELDCRFVPLKYSFEVKVDKKAKVKNISIHGFKIPSELTPKKGFFFVFPGNYQPVSSIAEHFIPISTLGYDVILFDYIYTDSGEYIPSMKNIIDASNFVINKVSRDKSYVNTRSIFYGISTGGIIALQSPNLSDKEGVLVLDSVPDKMPLWFCDSYIHPRNSIKNINFKKIDVLVIHGRNDSKVNPKNSEYIIAEIENNGGLHKVLENGYHPYEKKDQIHERIDFIMKFLVSMGE